MSISLIEEVQDIAQNLGQPIDEKIALWVLWERTGYPAFFMSDNPHEECLEQVRQYLAGEFSCARCGKSMDTDDGGMNVCDDCEKGLAEVSSEESSHG